MTSCSAAGICGRSPLSSSLSFWLVRSDVGILDSTGMPPLAAGANRRLLVWLLQDFAFAEHLQPLFQGRSSMSLLPPRQINGGKMVLYAFDVDQTLWLSGGPIKLADLMELRNSGHLLGLCGNFAAVTLRMPEWHYLFSFIGPMAMTKEAFLLQVRQYVPADEYVMVGNIQGVSGESDDHGAASRAGWRFISETAFSLGAR
jgi:hypothetical protein